MNLFIDTNIFLSFYHLTSDDLEELRKLTVLLREKKVKLYLPDQVVREFKRNREGKIRDGLNKLREQRLNLQFPQICKDYEDYKLLRRLQKEYETAHSTLLAKLEEDIANENLKADHVIKELFEIAVPVKCDEEILSRARRRTDLGDPPGKRGSLGDAVNWEAILAAVPRGEDCHFVTDDKDYASPLDDSTFNAFLWDEWREQKVSDLRYQTLLSSFFKQHFPDIRLASELEKDLVIRDFTGSGSFQVTHAMIAKLRDFGDFTAAQANEIVRAALENNQIYWIIWDADVWNFLRAIVARYKDQIDDERLTLLEARLEAKLVSDALGPGAP
ncbi:MAG: hypothetical protein A3J28_00245 [Acidobacteria bacterium RIFCSPLOWO2_12_FULL_60_22]|nr:MAG: hypothetical protein A3J28_00245 [Acidobacteria bacterium RIFCSPLOWO2_12_FULL_60_22]